MARHNARGTKLKMGDGADPEVFTAVAQLTNIDGPNLSRGMTETDDHDTTDAKTFIGEALYDGGDVPIEGHLDPTLATQDESTGLLAAMLDGVERNWKITLPGALGEFAFAAIVQNFKLGAPHEGKLMFSGSLKVSGEVDFA